MFISHVRPWSRGKIIAVRDFFISYSKSSNSFIFLSHYFPNNPARGGKRFSVPCLFNSTFRVTIYFVTTVCSSGQFLKFVAAKTFLRVWKEVITARRWIPLL